LHGEIFKIPISGVEKSAESILLHLLSDGQLTRVKMLQSCIITVQHDAICSVVDDVIASWRPSSSQVRIALLQMGGVTNGAD
jgi:hypothetical protein